MNLEQVMEQIKNQERFAKNITHWEVIPQKFGNYEPFPEYLDSKLISALKKKGIYRLYSHQRQALDETRQEHNITVVTPTASGKSLCYNLPVINTLLGDNNARAIYVFPTKALSQDQVSELMDIVNEMGKTSKHSLMMVIPG